MQFVKRENEWAIVADGKTSPMRMDGGKGAIVFGSDGQVLQVFEAFGKIHVEVYTGTLSATPKPCPSPND